VNRRRRIRHAPPGRPRLRPGSLPAAL